MTGPPRSVIVYATPMSHRCFAFETVHFEKDTPCHVSSVSQMLPTFAKDFA